MTNKRTLKTDRISCPLTAAYFVGHQYGVERFADETFQHRGSVYNKLNPDNDSNHLYLRDAVLLTEKADNNLILETWAHSRGFILVPVPDGVACDEDLSDQLLKLNEAMGEALGRVRTARLDGVIDPIELEQIKALTLKVITELKALETVVADQVRELKAV